VPLAALLAVAMAVGLSFGPHPFGFHGWPKAPASRSVDRVVRVAPDGVRSTVARREPADPSSSRQSTAPTRDRDVRPRRARHGEERGALASRRSSRRRGGKGHGPPPSPAPVQTPEPPGDDPVAEIPDGVPVAQVPDRIPNAAEAKPDAEPATPPPPSVEVRDQYDDYEKYDVYEEGGHRPGHDRGHKGRHGRH
jgi:hypothetical protein